MSDKLVHRFVMADTNYMYLEMIFFCIATVMIDVCGMICDGTVDTKLLATQTLA